MSVSGVSSYNTNLLTQYASSQTQGTTSTDQSQSGSTQASTGATGYSNTSTSALARFQAQMQQQVINQYTGYTQLQSTLGSFQNMMIGVISASYGDLTSGIKVTDSSVGYLSPTTDTSYSVNVSQLAKPQSITSGAALGTSATAALFKGGSLTIQPGAYSGGTFAANGSPVNLTIPPNASLKSVVSIINAAKAGVTASVVTDSGTGNVHLQLVGDDSGAANGFSITSADTGAGATSLATLAYTASNSTNYPAQTVTSKGSYGTDRTATTFKSGTLSIQLGTNGGSGAFVADGNPISIAISDNSSLDSIAGAVNAASAGVTASVVTDTATGNVHLQFSSSGSGAAKVFTISGTTTSGYAGTGTNALEGLTYATGSTTNFTATGASQAAQDAKYTVNGNAFQTPTNIGAPVAAGINLNLLKTGSTVVKIPGSPTAVTNAANSLVSTVNGLIQVVQQMTGQNGLLASDTTIPTSLTNDLSLTLNGSFNASKYTQSLASIGVTRQSDGTYAVNTTMLNQAFSADSAGVQSIISMAASAMMNLMGNYIGANGTLTSKVAAMKYQLPTSNADGNLSVYTAQTQSQQSATNAYTMLSSLYGTGVSSLFG